MIFEQEFHISLTVHISFRISLLFMLPISVRFKHVLGTSYIEMNFVTGSSSSAGNGGNLATRRTDKVCGELMVRIDGIECNLTGIPAPSPRPMSTGKI